MASEADPFRGRRAARLFLPLFVPLAVAFLAAGMKRNVLGYGIDHPDIGRRFSRVPAVSGARTLALSDPYPEGFLFFGPYLAVPGGRYEAAIHLRALPRGAGGSMPEIVRVSAVSEKGKRIHCQKDFQFADVPRLLRALRPGRAAGLLLMLALSALRDFLVSGPDRIKLAFWVFFFYPLVIGGRLTGARGDHPWAKGE